MTVATTKSNVVGSTSVWSPSTVATNHRPVNTTAPVITGTGRYTTSLSLSNGTWQGFPNPTYAYAWYRCATNSPTIVGGVPTGCAKLATVEATYTVTVADLGYYLVGNVTATNSISTAKAAAASVAQSQSGPVFMSTAQVSGEFSTGKTLTADTPSVVSYPTASQSRQWYRCSDPIVSAQMSIPPGCEAIASATSDTYVLSSNDEGFYITAATREQNALGSVESWAVATQLAYGRATFTSSGSWTVPAGVYSVDVLVVGGGGSGGHGNTAVNDYCYNASGGGGGGGGVASATLSVTPGQSIAASVGTQNGSSGFSTIGALGGSNGANTRQNYGCAYDGAGGNGFTGTNAVAGGAVTCMRGCGGIGGGVATFSEITGQRIAYGGGGPGGTPDRRGDGAYGAGGGGGKPYSTTGASGLPGVIILRWRTQ